MICKQVKKIKTIKKELLTYRSLEDCIKHDEYTVYYNLGNTYFKQNKFEAAIEVL